jgi:hypothetical protein
MTIGWLYLRTFEALTPPMPLTPLVACPLPSVTTATYPPVELKLRPSDICN